MQISQLYCSHCGAANEKASTLCFACSSPLSEVETPESATVLLNQRYRVLTSVGIGGFGTIYKVQDIQRANALFAVKQINLMNLSAAQIIETTEAFHREVHMLSSLHHENLPRIYDSFTDPHHWYMVMDFIEGETLEQYLAIKSVSARLSGMPLIPMNEFIAIGMQLCAVLGYLHKQQPPIVFRDLKPSNIMRTAQGHLFLIDFGIARQFKPGKAQDTLPLGSPGYAPPEQYGKAQTTPRADIYSFGALLHQFLSGNDPSEHPFQFAPLRMYGGNDLTELEALIQCMVHMQPEQRPTIDEVKEVFQRLQSRYLWQSPLPGNIFPVSQLQAPIAWQPPPGTSINPASPMQQQQQVPFPQASMVPGPQSSRRRFIRLGVGAAVMFSAGWFASSLLSHVNSQAPAKVDTTNSDVPVATAIPMNYDPNVLWSFQTDGFVYTPTIDAGVVYVADGWDLYAIDKVTGKQKWAFVTNGIATTTVLIANGLAYVGSNDWNLYAVDRVTGKQKWAFLTGNVVTTTPLIANGLVYVNSTDGYLYAIDAASGRKKWSFLRGGTIYDPVVANGLIYAGSDDGNLYAVDAITGESKWTFLNGSNFLMVVNGTIYGRLIDGSLYAINATTGEKKWATPPMGNASTNTSSVSLRIINDVLYVGEDNGSLYVIDATTGEKKWSLLSPTSVDASFSPTISNGVVYVGSFSGNLYAVDAGTGQKKWAFQTNDGVYSTPTVSNGVVYVGSNDNNLYAIDVATGRKKWAFATGNAVQGQSTVVNGVVYIGSFDKNIYAIDAATGKKKWVFPTGSSVDSMLTIVDDVIYVSSNKGNLCALTTP